MGPVYIEELDPEMLIATQDIARERLEALTRIRLHIKRRPSTAPVRPCPLMNTRLWLHLQSTVVDNANVVGIFRRPASHFRLKVLHADIDAGRLPPMTALEAAALIKEFLRVLQPPLFSIEVTRALHKLCSLNNAKELTTHVLEGILVLPPAHLAHLASVAALLRFVASNAELNKMNTDAIAVCIAPSMFTTTPPRDRFLIKHDTTVTKILIENADNIGTIPEHILHHARQIVGYASIARHSRDSSRKRISAVEQRFIKLFGVGKGSRPKANDKAALSESTPPSITSNSNIMYHSNPSVNSIDAYEIKQRRDAFSSSYNLDLDLSPSFNDQLYTSTKSVEIPAIESKLPRSVSSSNNILLGYKQLSTSHLNDISQESSVLDSSDASKLNYVDFSSALNCQHVSDSPQNAHKSPHPYKKEEHSDHDTSSRSIQSSFSYPDNIQNRHVSDLNPAFILPSQLESPNLSISSPLRNRSFRCTLYHSPSSPHIMESTHSSTIQVPKPAPPTSVSEEFVSMPVKNVIEMFNSKLHQSSLDVERKLSMCLHDENRTNFAHLRRLWQQQS